MTNQKQKALLNFKKTHSLLARLIKMAEEDKYCVDLMQQNLAAIGLLKSAHQHLMESHLSHCFQEAMSTGSPAKKNQMTKEILAVTKLYIR